MNNSQFKKPVYVHYGDDKFRPDDMYISNKLAMPNKPEFGLWGSREDANFTWKDWCIGEEFRLSRLEKSFKFTLAKNAKILKIFGSDIPNNLKPYVNKNNSHVMYGCDAFSDGKVIDFTKIIQDGYDAIEFEFSMTPQMSMPYEFTELYSLMYGWDCDSIVVFNSDMIKPC